MKPKAAIHVCPCDSGQSYATCCQPLHSGKPANTALALMRSRYSAYAMGLEHYLMQTWHSDTRPSALHLAEDQIKWLGLTILHTETTSPNTAIVEFIARFKAGGGRAECMHETSEFMFTDAWYYVTGKVN